jgi:hypothetical protein
MRDFGAWVMDALIVGAAVGFLYSLIWGGGFPWIYAIASGALLAARWTWRRTPTPGRLLVSRFANLTYYY